jgi:ribonuclease BN (tRNA processing enzyme)
MQAELVVIGCRAGSPGACGPASGYVVRLDDATLLVDCGPGVVAGLAQLGLLDRLDAVIVTHRHADHCADLVGLAYHRRFPHRAPPLPLYGPPSLAQVVKQVDQAFGIPTLEELRTPIATALPFTALEPNTTQEVLGHRVDTFVMRHPVETFALRFHDASLTYTADGAFTPELVAFARDSRVLLAEATYLSAVGRDLMGHGHMTAETVGQLARESGAGQLVVTHFADCAERDAIAHGAARSFCGPVQAAAPGLSVALE